MSLTSLLRSPSPIRTWFVEMFPHVGRFVIVLNNELEAAEPIGNLKLPPPETGIIGMAFDYRARLYFAPFNPYETAAWGGASLFANEWRKGPLRRKLEMVQINNKLVPRPEVEMHRIFEATKRMISEWRPWHRRLRKAKENSLNSRCLVLAHFEQFYRSAFPPEESPLFEELIWGSRAWKIQRRIARPRLLDDLRALSWSFYRRWRSYLRDPVVLNPTFMGSGDIGGADADFILGETLVDLKSSRRPRPIGRKEVWQLLGYVLLDYRDEYGIRSVGFDFPRHGLTRCWPVEALMAQLSGKSCPLPDWRRKFRRVVRAMQRQARGLAK